MLQLEKCVKFLCFNFQKSFRKTLTKLLEFLLPFAIPWVNLKHFHFPWPEWALGFSCSLSFAKAKVFPLVSLARSGMFTSGRIWHFNRKADGDLWIFWKVWGQFFCDENFRLRQTSTFQPVRKKDFHWRNIVRGPSLSPWYNVGAWLGTSLVSELESRAAVLPWNPQSECKCAFGSLQKAA